GGGAGGGGGGVVAGGGGFGGGVLAARRRLRADRVPVLRLEHRPAGARDAVRGVAGHLRRPRPAPVGRVPGGLGIRAGRVPDPAAGAAPARLYHGGVAERGDLGVPGEPVVAVVAARRGDRAGRRVLRDPDLGAAGHGPRRVRDRRVPGARDLPGVPRRKRQHPGRLHNQVHAPRVPRPRRGDRRVRLHDPFFFGGRWGGAPVRAGAKAPPPPPPRRAHTSPPPRGAL